MFESDEILNTSFMVFNLKNQRNVKVDCGEEIVLYYCFCYKREGRKKYKLSCAALFVGERFA